MKQFGMYTYNFDLKISGNLVSIRKYDNRQLKNALKPSKNVLRLRNKKNIMVDYKQWLLKQKALKIAYKEFLKAQSNMSRAIQKIKDMQRRERFYRSNIRAKNNIVDLIACNHKKVNEYASNKKVKFTKFMTLTFADSEISSDIKKANAELTKFMKRLSYSLYGIKKNVLKYIAIPETHSSKNYFIDEYNKENGFFSVKRTVKEKDKHQGKVLDKTVKWHFHLVLFNMPFNNQRKLQNIWGNGILDIRAIKGSSGKVAKYVGKYLGKTHKNENGKVQYEENKDGKAYSYKKYKRLGLENMKRYSCSRGLKRPKNYSIDLDPLEYKEIWAMIFNADFLTNRCNKINDLEKTEKYKSIDKETGELKFELYKNNKVNCKKIHGTERGSITYIDFEIKEKHLEAFNDYIRHLTMLKMDKKEIKQKSINYLFNFIDDVDWTLFINSLKKTS